MKTSNRFMSKLLRAGLTGSSALVFAATAMVGVAVTAPSGTALAQSTGVDEIVVTARRRSESIQDVPVAVSALSAGQLERGAIQTVVDLEKLSPNVKLHTIAQAGAALGASIRGMGFDDLEKTFEPTVGMSVDGVFMASNAGAVLDFFDIEAIEVLRGPQGTLFGRNTIAGVINIRRTQPTGEYGLKVEATNASYNRQDYKAVMNMPLGDRGGIKISLRDLSSDSYVRNVTRNERAQFQDSETAALTIRYDFTDSLKATATVESYNHQTRVPDILATGTSANVFCGALGLGCATGSASLSRANDYKTAYSSEPLLSYIQGKNATLNVEYTGPNYTIKSITGNMQFEELMDINSWGAPNPLFKVVRDQEFEQTTQEFQFTSNYDGPLNFVAGLYFLETDAFLDSGPTSNFWSQQDSEARAFFGELNYKLDDNWELTAGLRYTEEEKDFHLESFGLGAAASANRIARTNPTYVGIPPTYEDDNTSYRLIAKRKMDLGMVYASYSTGYRSGGFNARGVDPSTIGPFNSEEVESIELGLRAEPSESTVINLTVFTSDYTDKQENVVTDGAQCGLTAVNTCTYIRNAGEVSIDGVELETVFRPSDALTVRGSLGYLDASYDSFPYQGVACPAGCDIANRAPVVYAPELNWNLTFEHLTVLSKGELMLSGSYTYTDDSAGRAAYESYNPVTGPDMIIDAYETLDLSATYTTETDMGSKVKLVVYGTDVLEAGNRINRLFDAGAFAWGEMVPRRQFGVTLGLEF